MQRFEKWRKNSKVNLKQVSDTTQNLCFLINYFAVFL